MIRDGGVFWPRIILGEGKRFITDGKPLSGRDCEAGGHSFNLNLEVSLHVAK